MIHKTTRSILSVLLAVLLLVTSVPLTPAFADGGAVSLQSESGESEGLKQDGDGKYYISTAEELKAFRDEVNSGKTDASAVLTANIVLNEKIEVDDNGAVINQEKLSEWTPIGNKDHRYTGTFDGNGHTISGLYIDTADDQSLFGYVSGTVKNLSVSGTVIGRMFVGGVVGDNRGNVINCAFSGSVSGDSSVGGVVGYNGGTVENCYNTGTVTGTNDWVGGVVGSNSFSATVTNCYNTGNISGDRYVGGVVGHNYNGGSVTNSYNTGAVSGGEDVGGVVGDNSSIVEGNSSNVENCYNTGSVKGSGNSVGGVVGTNDSGTVENCYNTGSVTGTVDSVGGVVGWNDSGTVKNCYNTGEVSGNRYVGGVVGVNSSTVKNCYNTGKVIGSSVGGVVGLNFGNGIVTDCYFLTGTAEKGIGNKEDAEGAAVVDNPTDQDQFKDWDFIDTWRISQSLGFPVLQDNAQDGLPPGLGTAAHPYEIKTAAQLKTFRDLVNRGGAGASAHAKLMDNIDLSSVCGENAGELGQPVSWTPIGNSEENAYTGTFNGNGKTIENLYINNTTTANYKGLFGYVGSSGKVQNLTVSGSVKGDDYVGGVVGYNGGIVENCYNTGSVSGLDSVGGVAGWNDGSVENCYNTGKVSGGAGVGGVVGWNSSDANVTNCYNTGSVSGSYVGGVVGDNDSSASVANCYYQTGKGATVGIGGTTGDNSSQTAAKSLEDFHSGEVAYLLQSKQTDESGLVWGQSNLTATTSLPTLVALDKNAKTVYQVTLKYDHAGAQDITYYTDDTATPSEQPSRDGYTFDHWDKTEGEGNTITFTAIWTKVEEPTPKPEPEEPPYTGKYSYEVSTSVGDHGSLTVDRYATEGDKVTITVTPDEAYLLDDLSVTAGGKEVALTAGGDGTFSFTMPSADVKISATFAEDPDWTEPEEPATDVSDLFIDIAPDAWYKDAIQYAYDNGLMTGVSDTEFAPEATTTRAMIVSILARLENVTTAEAAGFADVDDNDWYATAVNWAANVGVVNGYEDNTFKPNTAITREQLAAILMNYAAYKGEDVSNRADLANYTDQPSTWANEAMQWAVAEKLITGVTADTLQPQGAATRAQVAAILQRFLSE